MAKLDAMEIGGRVAGIVARSLYDEVLDPRMPPLSEASSKFAKTAIGEAYFRGYLNGRASATKDITTQLARQILDEVFPKPPGPRRLSLVVNNAREKGKR